MITKEQALTASYFHAVNQNDPSSHARAFNWRRNGATKTWKTRPEEFRIPVKYGLYGFDYVTHNDSNVYVIDECPACKHE